MISHKRTIPTHRIRVRYIRSATCSHFLSSYRSFLSYKRGLTSPRVIGDRTYRILAITPHEGIAHSATRSLRVAWRISIDRVSTPLPHTRYGTDYGSRGTVTVRWPRRVARRSLPPSQRSCRGGRRAYLEVDCSIVRGEGALATATKPSPNPNEILILILIHIHILILILILTIAEP